MKTLYVSDLDGTLLNSKERLSDYTINVLNKIVEKGLFFSYATARSLVTAEKVTAGLMVEIPVIVYNGAFIVNNKTKKILCSNFFTEVEADFVREVLTSHNIFPIVYSYLDGIEKFSFFTGHTNIGKKFFLDSRKDDVRRREVQNAENVFDGNTFYYTCIGNAEELQSVKRVFEKDSRFYCVYQKDIYSGEMWFEIMPQKATKAHAIIELKKFLNCEQVISFGDGKNDIPMFEISDASYAVENAAPELKKQASAIIESNDNDGVARWLEKNILNNL